MPAELRAARAWKKSWENMQTTIEHKYGDRRQETDKGEMEERDWAKKVVWLEPYGGLLTRLGWKRGTQGGDRNREQQGSGSPELGAQLILDCLPKSDQATLHISSPLPYTPLSSEKWPPISHPLLGESKMISYFFSHMDPGGFCYLVFGLRDGRIRHLEHLAAPGISSESLIFD